MDPLYFAYGSNLSIARMTERVPSARAEGPAHLAGYRLTLDKRSRDGSGKANLRRAVEAGVHGALYRIDPLHWPDLDACEPGYARVQVRVEASQARLEAWTYVSEDLTDDPIAYEWYKRLIVDGAAEHGLPEDWQRWLRGLAARSDPSR